ncbi:SET domain-containing protein [Amylostereum chailletii]|nr:SET domain-containing protein [Amylostereum chailletii]
MSSFASIRSERQSKQPKSFISSAPTASEDSDVGKALVPSAPKDVSAPERLYQSLPASVDVRVTSQAGRGVYAKQPLKPGEIIFATKPHVHVLSTRNLEHFCSACASPAAENDLKRCTRCRVVWYCNTECQNGDWSTHKQECSALQRWAAGAPSPDVAIPAEPIRCLGRLLWTKQKKRLSSVWAREVDSMQSHRTSLPPEATESHTHFAHAVVKYLGLNAPGELGPFGIQTPADLVDLISRFTTNSLTLTAPSLTPIGVTVSPPVALINHSCEPNAVVVFPGGSTSSKAQEPLMNVIAIREIAPEEEVLTAYIDTTLPKEQRQHALRITYNFACKCTLCATTTGPDPREAMECPKGCGGTCLLPTEEDPLTRCVKCKAAVASTDEVLDAARIGQEALDKATSLHLSNLPKALQLTTNILPILASARLLPTAHPRLALSRLHQSLLLSSFPTPLNQDALDALVRATAATTNALSALLCPGHPIRALARAELGKLLAVDEPAPRDKQNETGNVYPPSGAPRLRLAYESLVQARAELLVGFGVRNEGGEVGREVREMVVRVERELAAWSQGVKNVLQDAPPVASDKQRR